MDDEANRQRPLAEIKADMKRAVRRGDNMVLLLAVMAAAALAWMTTPSQRASIVETWHNAELQRRLCQAYVAVEPDKSCADVPVCLPPMPRQAANGR